MKTLMLAIALAALHDAYFYESYLLVGISLIYWYVLAILIRDTRSARKEEE